MSDAENHSARPDDPATGEPPELSAEELEMLEQQLRELRVEDLVAQSVASILNLSARRILKEDEVDLDQARLGIDAVRALAEVLPAETAEALREPLSQIQLLYAQRAGGEGPAAADGPGDEAGPKGPEGSGLWVPGS